MKTEIYSLRAAKARDEAENVRRLAEEAHAKQGRLRHSDPEYDTCGRVATLYQQISDAMFDLAETFRIYSDAAEQYEQQRVSA